MSMSEFMTGTKATGRGASGYTYQAQTGMPWGSIPGGQTISTTGKVVGAGIKAGMGASVGQSIAKVAVGTAARAGVGMGASAAAGASAGSVVPGVGTAIGLAAGALAPFVLPHIPVVGAAVNKVPLIGGILSPKKQKTPSTRVVVGAGEQRANPMLSAPVGGNLAAAPGGNLAAPSRSPLSSQRYVSGRGFRR